MALDSKVLRRLRIVGYTVLASLLVLLVHSQRAFAQVDEGSITGTVQDTSGAVVPGAHVTLLNKDVGLTTEAITNNSGEYSFNPVRIGHYTVTVTAKGFSKTAQENLQVSVSQNLLVNVQLKPGAATETVEVTDAPPVLQTEDASVGQTVSEQTVNSLPLNGRNFTFLAQLGAGTQTPQADTRGNAASGAFSANGLRPAQNNYLLDGIDNNSNAVDFLNGTNYIVLPPVDAIEEFKVQTGEFSAEQGRSAGAVLNATIKSGTNSFHGAVWEFFRNDKLDAADWFEDNAGIAKGELRLNQFGGTAGGPILKNKLFFFGDYEGKRRVQGNTSGAATVPTANERSSGYTNLADILAGQSGSAARTDILGRTIPSGTVLDPATTRAIYCGQVDPVSGLAGPPCSSTLPAGSVAGYARDPFGTCSAGTTTFTLAACGLNQLPAGRLDANAIKLLNPTSNFESSPNLFEHANNFDTREDFNPSQKDQIFFRFSYVDDPQYIPGPFGGIADGGSFQQGIQTAKSDQAAAAYTHEFSPTTVNVARGGFNHLHTTRFGPDGSTMGIPAEFGIQGIQQVSENGGLPAFGFGGLATLGSNNFLPSDEISQTLQVTDDFTKIYGKHNFKMGIEYQHVKFSTLQPAWSRGQFDYNGSFTDIPNNNNSTTGIAQFLLPPTPVTSNSEGETISNGVDYSGGSDQVYASNINKTYDEKNYFATYFQDDWKVSPKLTLNLGLRWDYFGPIQESNGGQANFVPSGAPDNKPEYIIPATGKDVRALSSSFTDLLAQDGITLLQTNKYGKGLVQTQKANFAPRVGIAYQINNKLVARGGFGMFYNSFENQGYGPNIGENYPFVYNFDYVVQATGNLSEVAPVSQNTPFSGCATAGPEGGAIPAGGIGTASFESGFSCIPFTPTAVNASGLGLQGLEFAYQTPLTLGGNATLQYSLTRTLSIQAAYVVTHGLHLQTGVGTNNVSKILPSGASTSDSIASGMNEVPFPDFGHGSSYHTTVGESTYNGLQTKLEEQFSNGLSFLLAYTWSKTLGDAGDLLNGGSSGGYRAPDVPGLGPKFDRGLADFDLRNVLHFSGGYQLPFGKDKQFLHNASRLTDSVVGGWSTQWIVTAQGGQPITLGCPTGTTSGTGCNDINVPGQSQKLGIRIDSNHLPNWFGNPAAFNQPCQLGVTPSAPTGCVTPTTTFGYLGGYNTTTFGPGYRKFDFSMFKAFQLSERFSLQFRAEFFNILNHPNFNAPGFGGNGVVAIGNSTNFNSSTFGEIGSTRDAPFDPRQIQFALKLYY
jgi:Carboxypeptidase regulatory-like domain/TonB-dependent Receptor Plug Domain